MKFFNMVGKHCARCDGGIYTVWRTSANKKHYHPHCFTCAICNVVLENSKECGISNLKEIYCRECFIAHFSDNGRRVHRSCSISEQIENEILRQHAHNISLRQRVHVQDAKAATPKGISQQPPPRRLLTSPKLNDVHRGDASEAIDHGSYLIEGSSNMKQPMHNINGNSRHASMYSTSETSQQPSKNFGVERKISRIPRPTSASSKKCLTSNSTVNCVKNSANVKPTTEVYPRSPIGKLGRSVSLMQPSRTIRRPEENDKSNLVSIGTGTSSISFCPPTPRPRSASSSSATPTKRQCAASFSTSTSTNSLRNVEPQRYASQISSPLTRTDRLQNMKSGIPSTQDILSAIKRESSEFVSLHPFNQMNRSIYGTGAASALPRRVFNMTFDCPICIGSLVQGGGVDLKEGGSKGNVVTHCGHLFHRECMENWLKIKGNSRCPICSTLCVPETLQSVYLECNVSVDENLKTVHAKESSKFEQNKIANEAFEILKSEYDILKARYDEMIAENEEFSFKAAIASSLQSAYDMECRNRLQLQWENKKLMRQMEDLQNTRY